MCIAPLENPDTRVKEISIIVPFTVICPTPEQFSCRGLAVVGRRAGEICGLDFAAAV